MTWRLLALTITAAAALVAAGCGGGSSPDSADAGACSTAVEKMFAAYGSDSTASDEEKSDLSRAALEACPTAATWTAAVGLVAPGFEGTVEVECLAYDSAKETPTCKSLSGDASDWAAASAPTYDIDGSGMFVVGSEVKPGLYKATGDGYLALLKDAEGTTDSIIANHNDENQTYVQIKSSDKYFETNRFDGWTKVPAKPKKAIKKSFPGTGTYMVGVDIAPGTYKCSGSGYWERMSDARHDFDSIIANDNQDNGAIISVKASDRFLNVNRFDSCKLM